MQIKTDRGIQPGAGQPPAAARPGAAKPTGDDGAGRHPAPAQGDRVTLTRTAKTLMRLEQTDSSSPPVDAERVARLRADVERGSYLPDPARIAQRLLRFEAE